MKAKLVVNPVSGADEAPDYLPIINSRLRELTGDLDIAITVAERDAEEIAAAAVRDGYDHLFVAGGDGTLNEVLNGVAAAGALGDVVIGVLPLGTGNDFATVLGIPEDVEAALDLLQRSAVRAVDVGVLNGRYFINVSGGGFIAEVSDAVRPQLKTVAGKLAYLVGGAQVLLDHEPVTTRLHAEGVVCPGPLAVHMFAVCNSPMVGGGRLIAPAAAIDDGLFDVCVIEAMGTVEFVTLLTRVSHGEHVTDERVRYFRTPALDLSFDRRVKVNTDGQVLEVDRCEYRLLPGAARVLAPPRAVDAA